MMALGLDLFLLPDQEPVLLDMIPLQRTVVAVVTHLRLPTGMFFQCQSVNELLNIYNSSPALGAEVKGVYHLPGGIRPPTGEASRPGPPRFLLPHRFAA